MSTDRGSEARVEIGTEDPTWKAQAASDDPPRSTAPVDPGQEDLRDFAAPLAQPKPGDVLFGRYRVERLLGQGGMGSVWLVRHLGLDAMRALKLIISGVAFVPEVQARFRREARAMARLSHPN